jgi:hypothetical protein
LPHEEFDIGQHLGVPDFLKVSDRWPLRQAQVDRPSGESSQRLERPGDLITPSIVEVKLNFGTQVIPLNHLWEAGLSLEADTPLPWWPVFNTAALNRDERVGASANSRGNIALRGAFPDHQSSHK